MSAAFANDGALDRAASIYQDHLDCVSDLLFVGNIEECINYFALPLLIRTRTGETLIETRQDMLNDTRQHSESLNGHGVTNYIRLVKQARQLSETLIEGWHETYVLRDATSILPSYQSHMFLRDTGDGVWKVIEAEHELENLRFPLGSVKSKPGSFAETWQGTQGDIRVAHSNAEPLYRAFLDVLNKHQNAANFDGWSSQFQYPLEAHYDATDRVFNEPADMRAFFDAMLDLPIGEKGGVHRAITSADFISADRICGYHETTFEGSDAPAFGPVKSRMILTLTEGRWKCSSVTNSLSSDDAPPEAEFKPSSHLPTMSEIQKRMNKP
ncbi:hypothetical protein [Gymnodinialimonas hymeniacidonis]|uniref:hypothetical protein n=1 Tax=Gymnodinialimonas hymeniacidonis TaxID=3126508 RepID=UPI0034C6155D